MSIPLRTLKASESVRGSDHDSAAPAGVKPVVWRLVTNREAGDAHALIELVDWYRARWEIEMFFNVLKNACRDEAGLRSKLVFGEAEI